MADREERRVRSARSGRGRLILLAVIIPLILPALALFAYVVFALYIVWDSEQPRALPNGYRILTVNGNWHALCDPRSNSGASIGPEPLGIGQLAVDGPWVVGTLVEWGDSTALAWFVFDTRSGDAQSTTSEAQWRSKLESIGVDPRIQLQSPLSLPYER